MRELRFKTRDLALYSAPLLPHSLALMPMSLYVASFYSTEVGLPLAGVGAMLALTRLTDIVIDPFVGAFSDRLRTRIGRRKPVIIAGIPLMVLAVYFLFNPPAGVGLAYVFIWSFALYLGFTIIDLPYNAWGAELSNEYAGRSRVQSWRVAMNNIGSILGLTIALTLAAYGLKDTGQILHGLSLAFALLFPLVFAVALIFVREPPPVEFVTDARTWRERLAIIARNRPFVRLAIGTLFLALGFGVTAPLHLIMMKQVLHAPSFAFPLWQIVGNILGIAALPFWLWLARRIGKHRAFITAAVWGAIVTFPVLLLGEGDWIAFVVLGCLRDTSLGALGVLPASMNADVVDRDNIESGEQRTGVYFAFLGMSSKLAVSGGVLLATSLPALFAFQPSDPVHTAGSIFALKCIYVFAKPLSFVPAIIALWHFPITRAVQQQMQEQIQAKLAADDLDQLVAGKRMPASS